MVYSKNKKFNIANVNLQEIQEPGPAKTTKEFLYAISSNVDDIAKEQTEIARWALYNICTGALFKCKKDIIISVFEQETDSDNNPIVRMGSKSKKYEFRKGSSVIFLGNSPKKIGFDKSGTPTYSIEPKWFISNDIVSSTVVSMIHPINLELVSNGSGKTWRKTYLDARNKFEKETNEKFEESTFKIEGMDLTDEVQNLLKDNPIRITVEYDEI